MANITLRATKGSPLTNNEVDANFNNLNTELGTKLDAADFTGAEILTKIKTVDGALSGLDADTLDGYNQDTANTANTIVRRDGSGNFAANTITANTFSGEFNGTAAITSGSIAGITDIAITDGGTGASTAAQARTNLGLAIGTDVQQYSSALDDLVGLSLGANEIIYTDGNGDYASAPITATARSLLDDANTSAMRATLGLRIGTDIQPYDTDLNALAGLTTTGIVVRTASGTATTRSIAQGAGVSITNGTGVSGNITISNTGVTSLNGLSGAISNFSGHLGGGSDRIFLENDQSVTTNYTITSGKNAMTAGPITINNGVTVTVPSGSTWTIV